MAGPGTIDAQEPLEAFLLAEGCQGHAHLLARRRDDLGTGIRAISADLERQQEEGKQENPEHGHKIAKSLRK